MLTHSKTPKAILKRLTVLTIVTLTILIARLRVQNFESPKFRPEDNPVAYAGARFTRILSQNYLYVLNAFLLVCPIWLSVDWSFDSIRLIESLSDVRVMFIAVLHMLLLALVVRGIDRNRKILIALALLIVPFSPASGIIKLGFVIAERILYTPSIGYSVLIAMGMKKLIKKFHRHRKVIYAMFTIVLVFNTLRSNTRSMEWTNERRLFSSSLKVVPNNSKLYYNIARISSEERKIETSIKLYQKAIQLHPNYESAHMNLGNVYRELQQFERAKYHLQKSVEINDEFPTAWMNLGIVHAMLKDYKKSEQSYFKALSYRKNYANCYYNLGNLYIEMKNATAAIESWRKAVSISPNHRKAWSNILAFYDNQASRHDDVLKYSDIALTFLPNDTNILFSKANSLGKLSRFEEAETIFKQIIEIEPKKPLFYANIGVLYHRWGKKELAKKNYEIALNLDTSLSNVRNNLLKLQGAT